MSQRSELARKSRAADRLREQIASVTAECDELRATMLEQARRATVLRARIRLVDLTEPLQ
jgi:prefoldin subunit 5